MKNFILRLFLLASTLCLASFTLAAHDPADEAAIRKLEVQQQEAWNRHDATAYANLFTEDGDCVNVVGWWWKGRAEIEKKLTAAYAFIFAQSVLTIGDVDIRFLTADMAVAHVRWTMTGARTPHTLPKPEQGIQTQIVQKSGGNWLIAVFQNTNSIPEMPFPQVGPPGKSAPPKP